MTDLNGLLDTEGAAAEGDQESPLRADVKVTRGHDRAKNLQIRLNEDKLRELVALAADR